MINPEAPTRTLITVATYNEAENLPALLAIENGTSNLRARALIQSQTKLAEGWAGHDLRLNAPHSSPKHAAKHYGAQIAETPPDTPPLR